MNFAEMQEQYADLIVQHGMNVQPGQLVNVATESVNREFALMVVNAAYRRGAKYVHLSFNEPAAERSRLLHSRADDLEYVPAFIKSHYDCLLDEGAASVRLLGPRDPDLLSDLDPPLINRLRLAQRRASQRYLEEGIGKSKVHWTVAAAATPAWGKKVFPDLDADAACRELWQAIFSLCRADKPDCLEQWKAHNARLKARAQKLSEMKIATLHFTGPGTDLQVRLSQRARFAGGSEPGPHGVEFEPNLPTEEVFTTPDWRGTSGTVRTTRPFFINGKLVKGLELEFREGEIASFEAAEGAETFATYISSDPGAKRLGEVALVGIDSPIYKSGLVFQEILFDENAACHIAVGLAYKFCLEGGSELEKAELDKIGCNESHVHTDMMISSEEVDVTAHTYAGDTVKLIEKGHWT